MLNNQLSSSQINETLLNAMKTIAQKEVQNLEFDVTEKYVILRKDKDSQGKTCYIIEANGSEWEVYASNNEEYHLNDIVLVNIPKNILTEKKYIIGLAEQSSSKCYLPNSNFIPIVTLKDEVPNLLNGYETGFLSFEAKSYPEQFLLCDTIYLKFDIKTTKDILENYQFSIILDYGEKHRQQEYTFTNNLFTGNIYSRYYSTQDISFNNILNFDKIQNIALKIAVESSNPKELLEYIKLRNLEFSIGKTAAPQDTGLSIVSVKNSLSYNLDENDFTRKLGLIWYNRNKEGDFIGFDTGMKIPLDENKNPIWDAVIANEYEYTQEKNDWNKKKQLYDLEYCPYDLQGLQYVQDIGDAETIFYNIINIISTAGTCMYNYISTLTNIYNKMLQVANIDKITDSSDKNLVNIIYSNLLSSWSEFQSQLITKKDKFFNIVQTAKEDYSIWSNYIGKMFLNVRKMQELEQNLDIKKLQLKELIQHNQELNFSNIIEYIYNELQQLEQYYQQEYGYIYADFDNFNQAFLNYENGLISAGAMSETDIQKLEKLKIQISDLIKEIQNIIKVEKIDKIYQIFMDNNYKSYLNQKLIPPSYWNNSTYLNTANYGEIIGKYYNDYYYQYQYYINNQSFIDEQERLLNSLVTKENAFNPVFIYSKQEQEDRDKDGKPDDTIAIYWYQENIDQNEEDLLLQESGWDLISTNDFQNYLPTYRISGNYAYLNKATPFNNMIDITLPDNVATTTVKVLLYYNHQQVGNASLTFVNEQYEDIGFKNSLLDIEYDTEGHSISNNEGFSINVTCYDKENALETVEPVQVLISEKRNPTVKKFPTLLIQKQGVFNHTRCYALNKDIVSPQKLIIDNYKSEKYFIPYGVISFSLYSNEKDISTSYLPLSWSPNSKELSLRGAKMISVKNDGSIEYDKYNINSDIPLAYSLIGEKNIKITNCVVEYLDNKLKISNGRTKIKKADGTIEEIVGDALTVYQQSDGQYILNINNDSNQIRTCLKNFRPYLKISGTFGEQNENDFIFYQSLFILHESYNYNTFKFNDETSIPPTPTFTFIDPREEALIKDIAEQTQQGEVGYSFLGAGVIVDKNWAAANKALQHILNNSNQTIIDAYNFYFEVVRVSENIRGVVPDKKWYEERLSQLNNNKEKLTELKTIYVYDRQTESIKSITQSIGSWIADLFRELLNFYNATENDQKNFLSALELRYTDIQAILKLIKEDDKQ